MIAQIVTCALLAPIALFGTVIHYPAYRFGGFLSLQLARREQDVLSTFKIISAMLLFPLTWIVVALISWRFAGWLAAVASLILSPASGFIAIRFFEKIEEFAGSFLALALFVMRRRSFLRLLAERAAIRREILALGDEAALRIT